MQKMIEQGTPLALVEYRSGKAETITYRDKTTGRSATMKLITHNVEAGNNAVQIGERVPDEQNLTDWQPPFKKGSQCVLVIESFTKDKGVYKAGGKLHPLAA